MGAARKKVEVPDLAAFVPEEGVGEMVCGQPLKRCGGLFCVGDVVRLRSGGFAMTVTAVTCDRVQVVWANGDEVEGDEYPASCLEHAG